RRVLFRSLSLHGSAVPQGRLLVLLAHREGKAVPDPLRLEGALAAAEDRVLLSLLLVLLAHREGKAVPDPLPPQGLPRGARAGVARSERPRAGQAVPLPRGLGGERRRQPPRLLDRRDRLPPVRPSRPRSAHHARRSREDRPRRFLRLVGRRFRPLLRGRGSAGETPLSALPPQSGQREGRPRLRGEGPLLQPRRR